tara:strand:+ start:179 stop:406 length:228 start_codon:yes stop_codon:yes gene_type:complete
MNTTQKYFLEHPSNGEIYSFFHYGKESDGYGVQIKHNGQNCQEVISGKHHSDGCYHLSVGRKQWDALVSQGFKTQ